MDEFNKTLELYLVKKAPALPKNVKDIIVKFAPWLEILSAVMSLPAIMGLFGLSAMMYSTPYGGYVAANSGFNFSLSMIFLIAGFALSLLAIPGLMKKTKMGWNYVFYAALVNAVYSLITMQIGSLIIGTLISLYLLFQVKSYYK